MAGDRPLTSALSQGIGLDHAVGHIRPQKSALDVEHRVCRRTGLHAVLSHSFVALVDLVQLGAAIFLRGNKEKERNTSHTKCLLHDLVGVQWHTNTRG